MIIATAGHVDHGKTLLVKAITGVDTDRLEEEKARGLTIDLGFAYCDTASGQRLGFVDVPGHSRFISNMLAGVGSVDFALMVVSADDGPMPQTREHLAILDLLGFTRGAIALTKTDRVTPERLDTATQEIQALIHGSSLQSAPILPVSAIEGTGIQSLTTYLEKAAENTEVRNNQGHFRLAIDRRFTVKGAGVVVTGSAFAGSVQVGQDIHLVTGGGEENRPVSQPIRVRALHVQDRPASESVTGDRCAANITGAQLSVEGIHRGDWLTSNPDHPVTDRFDVNLKLLPGEAHALRHWTPVHIHTAANHVTGRVAILEGKNIAPGNSAPVQLVADERLPLCIGDRVIIRDQGAERTLGGGPVIDCVSPGRGRARPDRIHLLKQLSPTDPATSIVAVLAASPYGTSADRWHNGLNMKTDSFLNAITEAEGQLIGNTMIASSALLDLHQEAISAAESLHESHRDRTGFSLSMLARAMGTRNPDLISHVVNDLVRGERLKVTGTTFSIPGFRGELTPADATVWAKLEPLLSSELLKPPVLHDLARSVQLSPKQLEKVLGRCVQLGFAVHPVPNRYFLPTAVSEFERILRETAGEGEITVRQYRDATGVGRNLAIEILEYFDRQKITLRKGDSRVLMDQPR